MKEFEKPEIQIVYFDTEDVIAASECISSYSYGWEVCSGRANDRG